MTDAKKFDPPPREMSEGDFVARFGGVYEHSPWIALATYQGGLSLQHDTVEGLAAAMADTFAHADRDRQMAVVRAHPDLAGKAARQGELTQESTTEQAGAGIDQCTPGEFERFQRYNSEYTRKFGFPFIMAVKGSNRHAILGAFEERLNNDFETEFQRALAEINKIARFRLDALASVS